MDSEAYFDFLSFSVDESSLIEKASRQLWFVATYLHGLLSRFKEFNHSIKAGPHIFRWQYSKDGSGSMGKDRAELEIVEIVGTKFSELDCVPCAPGCAPEVNPLDANRSP